MKLPTRRALLLGLGVGVPAVLAVRAGSHLGLALWRERGGLPPLPDHLADDASRLELVEVAERFAPGGADPVPQIRQALAVARQQQRPLCIAGARHTMGGHTLMPGAIVLDMAGCDAMSLGDDGLLRVGAGARWSQVIEFLRVRGRAPWVMQSNSDFSLGGTLGANAHGWQHDMAPFVSTVDSLRVVTADGELRECSRAASPELFAAIAGGYGLLGVVVDLTVRVVDDEVYRAQTTRCHAIDYPEVFAEHTASPEVRMAYGRLSVDAHRLLTEAVFTTFTRVPGATPGAPVERTTGRQLARAVVRAQIDSDYGKRLRWDLERLAGSEAGDNVARSQIMSEPVAAYANRRDDRTDILHEYFVPPTALVAFLAAMRRILPRHPADLLNVTIRSVRTDDDAMMRYATEPMFSLVMLFSIERTAAADDALAVLTRELIDAALDHGGRYYLPYRLHATAEQFARAYPQAAAFFERKRAWDPELLLRNRFFARYG